MLASREIHGIEVHDIYESAWKEIWFRLEHEEHPATVGDYVAVLGFGWFDNASGVEAYAEPETEPINEVAKLFAHMDSYDLRRMSEGKTFCFNVHEIWHIVADPVTEEEQETDTELEFARRAFEQARNLIGEEWCEYYRGWTHGLLDMLEETNYTIGYHIAWSDDYSNWYLQRVELIKYQSEEPWTPEVIDSETC